MMLDLPPLPSRLLPLHDEQSRWLAEHYPDLPDTPRAGCVTCAGRRTFRWYGPESEPAEYRCPCPDQYIAHRRLLYSGVGVQYQRLTWTDFYGLAAEHADLAAEYVERLDSYLGSGVGMILHGAGRGTGKTMYAMLLIKRVVGAGRDVYATTFGELLDSYSSGWRDKADRDWFARRVRNAGLLLVDDLGREYKGRKDMGDRALEDVLRHRVQHSRPTFVTTNYSMREVAEGYGGHTMSVLTERSIPLEFTGPDRRPEVHSRMIAEIRAGLTRPVVFG